MTPITTPDGTQIYFKDWGPKSGQPIVFHHGWPLSADDWDTQMLYFLGRGYRVIAHDRRGHGRSSQGTDGHDMDHYAADLAAVVEHLGISQLLHHPNSRRVRGHVEMENAASPMVDREPGVHQSKMDSLEIGRLNLERRPAYPPRTGKSSPVKT